MTLRESDMSAPVTSWLQLRGHEVYAEVRYEDTRFDLVGRTGDVIEVVELKRSCTARLLDQAWTALNIADFSWACVASVPSEQSIAECRRRGIGLLCCRRNRPVVIVEAPNSKLHRLYRADFMAALDRRTSGGTAGEPNQAGRGEAQEVSKRVREYLKVLPRANWREIWGAINNPYRSPNELKRAMKSLEQRREWRDSRKART